MSKFKIDDYVVFHCNGDPYLGKIIRINKDVTFHFVIQREVDQAIFTRTKTEIWFTSSSYINRFRRVE